MTTRALVMPSPVGPVEVRERDGALVGIRFALPSDPAPESDASDLLEEAARQLGEYFAGRRREFDVPLRPEGTAFRQRVWAVLATVPWGTTTTYGAIAAELGMPPGASRAVGAANGANPIAILLPCHRVIGAGGTLTGYAGGLERKAALLRLEGIETAPRQAPLF